MDKDRDGNREEAVNTVTVQSLEKVPGMREVQTGNVKERSKQVKLIHAMRGPKRRNSTERSYQGKL